MRRTHALPLGCNWFAAGIWSLLQVGLDAVPVGAQIVAVPSFQVANGGETANLRVTVGADGALLFSWIRLAGTARELYARRFSAAGVALGPAVRLDSGGPITTSTSRPPPAAGTPPCRCTKVPT